MPPCYTLLNHEPTPEQREDLRSHWEAEIVLPSEEVKYAWASIPPEGEITASLLEPFFRWVKEAPEGSFLWVQGEYGATYQMVRFALQRGLVPIYATTRRDVIEEKQPDNSVVKRVVFRHVQFRRYEPFSSLKREE